MAVGDQIFPWDGQWFCRMPGLVLTSRMLMAQSANGMFVSLPEHRWMWTMVILTSVCWSQLNRLAVIPRQIRSAIEDGVVEPHEKTAINEELYSQFRSCRSI